VTEEVTGIDIVQDQILIAEGKTLADATGASSQADSTLRGHALQTRVTTEDPTNNFIPDYGHITRYYYSLLTKVTAWAPTPEKAIHRMDRTLRELRIRGVSTNIDFVINLLKQPTFLSNEYSTKFIDTTPDLFNFKARRDRTTKILTYIADTSMRDGHQSLLATQMR